MKRYTIQEIANLCDQDTDNVIAHLVMNFADIFPDLDKLQAATELDHETAEATLNYFGAVLDEYHIIPQAKVELTEAIQVASTQFTQTLVMNIDLITELLTEQTRTLGTNVGSRSAVVFTQSYIEGFNQVINPVVDHLMNIGDSQLAKVDDSLMQLGNQAQALLGESTRRQQQINTRLAVLKAQRRGLIGKIQNG